VESEREILCRYTSPKLADKSLNPTLYGFIIMHSGKYHTCNTRPPHKMVDMPHDTLEDAQAFVRSLFGDLRFIHESGPTAYRAELVYSMFATSTALDEVSAQHMLLVADEVFGGVTDD